MEIKAAIKNFAEEKKHFDSRTADLKALLIPTKMIIFKNLLFLLYVSQSHFTIIVS